MPWSLEVEFAPSKERATAVTGSLKVQSDDPSGPLEVKLSGLSRPLCLEVIPSSIDLGAVQLGCGGPATKVTVLNVGTGQCKSSVSLKKIQTTGPDAAAFSIMSAPPVPKTLGAGQSLEVGLMYRPQSLGRAAGILEIETSNLTYRSWSFP